MTPELQELGLLWDAWKYPKSVVSCDALLKHLLVDDQKPQVLLPALTHLCIAQAKFNPALLAQVVESRCNQGKEISRIATVSLVEIDYFLDLKEAKKIVDLYRGVLGTWLEDSGLGTFCDIVFESKMFKNFARRCIESL
ncbi:hypothetical protein BDV98DRAFT_593746 [Pterulicium gracile]|uniref:Uncharacterized protein n=1 Tax=Pterulicium gracile TaxID=1884261 RepID=A0A5C3QI06_9AGAR|nr:hypothetical protein BDV98DRAFT_593746 [Pterula gracilis]